MQLLDVDAEVEHQQAAQLRIAVLLDDEVDVVLVEELPHLVAEREAAHAHELWMSPVSTVKLFTFNRSTISNIRSCDAR